MTARERLSEALRAYASFEMWEELLGCLEDIAELAIVSDSEKAARLLSAIAPMRVRLKLPRSQKEERALQGQVERLRRALGEEGFNSQWELAESLDIRAAIAEALTLAIEPALS